MKYTSETSNMSLQTSDSFSLIATQMSCPFNIKNYLHHCLLKQCDGMWQKLVSTFVVIKCSNEPSYHHIWIPQCIHVGCFAWNGSIQNTGLPIQYYSKGLPGPRYPKSNCRFCHNYNSYSFHIHNIMSILNVLWFL